MPRRRNARCVIKPGYESDRTRSPIEQLKKRLEYLPAGPRRDEIVQRIERINALHREHEQKRLAMGLPPKEPAPAIPLTPTERRLKYLRDPNVWHIPDPKDIVNRLAVIKEYEEGRLKVEDLGKGGGILCFWGGVRKAGWNTLREEGLQAVLKRWKEEDPGGRLWFEDGAPGPTPIY